MDRQTQKIIEGFRRVQEKIPWAILVTVIDVNINERTIDVQDANRVAIYDVNLQAASEGSTGLLTVPTVGSTVVIEMTEGGVWYVSSFSGVDNFSIKTASDDLKVWLTDLINTIEQLTVTTATGPSGTPINIPDFETIKTRLSNLLI
ncbi:MAG: hypothetical protein ACRDE2_06330 [Chitinophagaceae bacterium]